MKLISKDEFYALCQQNNIKVLKNLKDSRPKILETSSGEIIKIFYARDKWFSAWKNRRAAIKFCDNSKRLQQLGILAPTVHALCYCKELGVYLVNYHKLSGEDLRVISRRGGLYRLADVAKFIATLHQKGIFFRSLHLENLLYLSSGQFALVDIVDVRFRKQPLNLFLRYRNIKHMFSIRQDKKIWNKFGYYQYLQLYYQFVDVSRWSKWWMSFLIGRHLKSV